MPIPKELVEASRRPVTAMREGLLGLRLAPEAKQLLLEQLTKIERNMPEQGAASNALEFARLLELLQRAGINLAPRTGIASGANWSVEATRWLAEELERCAGDAECILLALAIFEAWSAFCAAADTTTVTPPTPGPPDRWPERPGSWPWPLPWPPVVVYGGPTTAPVTPPRPLVSAPETLILFNCKMHTLGNLSPGERVCVTATSNGGGFLGMDSPGSIDVLVNGTVVATLVGNNRTYVDGPGRLEFHLKGPEDKAQIEVRPAS